MQHPSPKAPAPLWTIDLAGIGTCALLAACWYLLGLQPLSDARAARTALETELLARTTKQESLTAAQSKQKGVLDRLLGDVAAASIHLEGEDQINARLRSLAEWALAGNLRLDELRPGAAASFQHYTGVPIRLAGTGSYDAVARFLHTIHEKHRDVGVIGLELRGEPEASDKPPTFAIQLLWYAAPKLPAPK
jgi:Tfp pilus assembly protein PilO